MTDLDNGWLRYSDGKTMVTDDGGLHWRETANESSPAASAGSEGAALPAGSGNAPQGGEQGLSVIVYDFRQIQVKQSQFVTEQIGWALSAEGEKTPNRLYVTVDGGKTWRDEVNSDVRAAVLAEKQRLELIRMETALYASSETAERVMKSEWSLLPDQAYPGDVVLLRSGKPGEAAWQGKTYVLQPFGAGYFTYIPIPRQTPPGKYSLGGAVLTITDKKFDSQYLTVTSQMESMRQDTKRIEADQVKIDAARANSKPEFIALSGFVQPIEGRLTTPFGYTRYINGKLDSSHMAIDLAAKEGTPIKAAGDGIVALADSLYLTGNAIYIDHGMGLFSQYAHLLELKVKAGDSVKKGDIIGLVGSTGFSTGPHLHFTFWAHNVPVNPNLFFGQTPFHWQAEKNVGK